MTCDDIRNRRPCCKNCDDDGPPSSNMYSSTTYKTTCTATTTSPAPNLLGCCCCLWLYLLLLHCCSSRRYLHLLLTPFLSFPIENLLLSRSHSPSQQQQQHCSSRTGGIIRGQSVIPSFAHFKQPLSRTTLQQHGYNSEKKLKVFGGGDA